MSEKKENRSPFFSKFSIRSAVNILTSLTFLILAAYIAFYLPPRGGSSGMDSGLFAALVGAYGIWRLFRPVRAQHDEREE